MFQPISPSPMNRRPLHIFICSQMSNVAKKAGIYVAYFDAVNAVAEYIRMQLTAKIRDEKVHSLLSAARLPPRLSHL